MSKTNTKIVENGFFNCKLTIKDGEDLSISVRPDGFVNATQLCKAGKKKFNDWKRLDTTQQLIQVIIADAGIPASAIIDIKKGGNVKNNQGSWIHPDLAVQLAQWISPHFAIQVSRWIRELALTGKVELGKEKSNEELLKLQQDFTRLSDEHKSLLSDHKILQNNHNNILKRRNRTDFDYGNVIYIISHPAFISYYNVDYYKIGKTTQKRDETEACFKHRLGNYNTCAPVDYTVHYLLYIEDNDYVEKSLKLSYALQLNPSNKEWIRDVKLDYIIDFLRKLCALMKIDHKEVVFENLGDIKKVEDMVEEEEEELLEEEAELVEEEEELVEDEEENIEEEKENQEDIQKRVCKKCSKNKDIDMFKKHGRGYSLECDKPYQRPRGNCLECNSMLFNKQSKRCVACAKKNTRIVDRPSYEQLKRDLENMSYVACGKKYGVSDNSIRKWIRFYQGKPTKPVFKV